MGLGWYDKFAPFYDAGTLWDLFYRDSRKYAVDLLYLTEGATVFDVFCGTGKNFPLIKNQAGKSGYITAVDKSGGMLDIARKRAEKIGLGDKQVEFLKEDLSTGKGINWFCECIEEKRPYHVLFTLGLTCLPTWKDFTSRVIDSLPSGARLSIMDVYSRELTFGAKVINWIGEANSQQPVWEILEERCESFTCREYRPFKIFDVSVMVAAGSKP